MIEKPNLKKIQCVFFTNDTDDIDDNVSDSNESDSNYVVSASESDNKSTNEQEMPFCFFHHV